MKNLNHFSQILIIIGIVSFLVTVAFIYMQSLAKKKREKQVLGQLYASPREKQFNEISQSAYNFMARSRILRRFVLNVRKRLETLAVYDEYTLRREVMKIIFTIMSVAIFIILLLVIIRPSFLVTFWILLGIVFISGVLIDFFVYRVEYRLLYQLKEFNNRIRFFYQQTKMVDEAIFSSIEFVGPEMKIHAERIHNILTSIEPNKELMKYEEVAPTRFLKVLAGLSLLVKEEGDNFSDKGSAFLRSLSAINQELNNEILYRSKLSYNLRSLSTLSLLPIFFALPLKNWAIHNFPIMINFYNSRIGFLAEIFVYAVALVCYLWIRKMREVTEAVHVERARKTQWEQKVFDKMPFVEKLMKVFSPTPFTKKHFELKQLLKDTNTNLKVEWLTFRRFVIGLSVFILLTSGFIYSHIREKNGVLNTSVPITMFAGNVSQEDLEIANQNTEFDKQVIEQIKNSDVVMTEDDLKALIAARMGDLDVHDPKVKVAYDRIVGKWNVVKNSFFKWYELIIVLLISWFASYMPILSLKLKKHLRFKEMETETHQLLVLISSLREFEGMSVYIILTWMERFSVVFKKPIQISLLDFDSGQEEALEQLNEMVSFEPFQQIVERLKLALSRLSIKESFDDIDMEREFYLEQRKEAQERSIESKGVIGNILGLAPVMCLTFCYLVIPLLYISVVQSGEIIQHLL